MRKTAEVLLRCGVDKHKIIEETGISYHYLNEIQSARSLTFSTTLNSKDKELADAVRELAWKAMEVANETLMFGAPADRMILARGIVGRSMALIGAEKTSKIDELRDSFNELIGSTQAPEEFEYDLPPEDSDEVDAT